MQQNEPAKVKCPVCNKPAIHRHERNVSKNSNYGYIYDVYDHGSPFNRHKVQKLRFSNKMVKLEPPTKSRRIQPTTETPIQKPRRFLVTTLRDEPAKLLYVAYKLGGAVDLEARNLSTGQTLVDVYTDI